MVVSVDTEELSNVGSSIGRDMADAITSSVQNIEVPKIEVDRTGLESLVVKAELDGPVKVQVDPTQINQQSVGADKRVDDALSRMEDIVDIAESMKFKLAEANDTIRVLNKDVESVKEQMISREDVQQIAEASVQTNLAKTNTDIGDLRSSLDAHRSHVYQLEGKVSYIDEKYDYISNNLRSQTHSLV